MSLDTFDRSVLERMPDWAVAPYRISNRTPVSPSPRATVSVCAAADGVSLQPHAIGGDISACSVPIPPKRCMNLSSGPQCTNPRAGAIFQTQQENHDG